jgi:aspartyl-tRNA(Asn)/glutamyl-tRNA(Gln) amidotransferase subunit B
MADYHPKYDIAVGLETHVQLKTRSKMWCGCANQYGSDPNTNVCPVCMGMPGVLPVANDEALRLTVLTGLLLNCDIPKHARFDRKNYFYPDVPKNYQITQLEHPSTQAGYLDFELDGNVERVRITRAHLEEDVGKSFHFDQFSGVDYNRAGVPLLEIVSEPDITTPDMAQAYLNALKDVLVYGGISDCDMEKGMVRCDVNISVRPKGQKELGQKVEIKNMNTFSGARKAIIYEIERQINTLESGGSLVQETRRWDDLGGITESMRSKEMAHDYRYFPDPDLMPFEPTEDWLASVQSKVVELPLARKNRFMESYGLPASDALTFVDDVALGHYFEAALKDAGKVSPKAIANWIINNLRGKLAEASMTLEDLKILPNQLPKLVQLVDDGKISGKIAQEVFADMFESGADPEVIVDKKGLAQVSDTGALEGICDEVIAANPKSAEDFRAGKAAALNFLKGQVMKLTKGKANPNVVGELLEKKLTA